MRVASDKSRRTVVRVTFTNIRELSRIIETRHREDVKLSTMGWAAGAVPALASSPCRILSVTVRRASTSSSTTHKSNSGCGGRDHTRRAGRGTRAGDNSGAAGPARPDWRLYFDTNPSDRAHYVEHPSASAAPRRPDGGDARH